jgi:hypothetical protein
VILQRMQISFYQVPKIDPLSIVVDLLLFLIVFSKVKILHMLYLSIYTTCLACFLLICPSITLRLAYYLTFYFGVDFALFILPTARLIAEDAASFLVLVACFLASVKMI